MLDFSRSRIQDTKEYLVVSGETVDVEGAVMQVVLEDNVSKVKKSAGVANSIFAGFSYGEPVRPTDTVKVEVLTATSGANPTVTLSRSSVGQSSMLVLAGGEGGTKLTGSATPDAPGDGEFGLSTTNDKIVNLHADEAEATIYVVYRYNLTVLEAQGLIGDGILGATAGSVLGQVGVIRTGEIFTDQYDTSINWSAVDTDASGELLKGGANGRVSIGGNGCIIPGHITSVPTVDSPFLGIYFAY